MITSNLLFCVEHFYNDDYCGKEHSHPCYEIVYYLDGRGEVSFSGRRYPFEKDTFMVCAPEVKHIEKGERDTKVLYIGFELYGEVELTPGVFLESKYGIKEYLEKIYFEIKHWTDRSYQLVNLFCSIIVIMLTKGGDAKESELGRNLDHIVSYISAHYQEDISVRQLAQMVGYSYDYFRKAFFKAFNITVNDFILKKRIDAATELLKDRKIPIKAVALRCGFSSAAQFCTKYREAMGMSPKQMQKAMEVNERYIAFDRLSG